MNDEKLAAEASQHHVQRLECHYDPSRTKKIYSQKSQELQRWVKELWGRFCNTYGKAPLPTLRSFHTEDLYEFFHWMLRERRGRIRKARTIQTYWNTLTLVRQLETKQFEIAPRVQVEMCGARQNLIEEFGLCTEKEEKPIMRAEDEFELLRTLWESGEVELQHERLRVQLALMIQLAGITGNRPGALRRMQYKDLKIALLPDPAGGERPRLVMDFTFKHTKRYMGAKDPNTFPVPDIPQETCLLLCPQIMLLGLLFADGAFAVPELTPAELFQLRIPPGKRELVIPIDESKAELPLFRRTERTVHGIRMSEKAVTENWLRERLRPLGEITSFDFTVKPYCFRRGHGEALDSSSHISDSQRNLVLQHSSSAVFQHNYLSHYITQDTQAAYRGLEPQTAVIRLASGMSRSIDPHRPRALTDEQLALLNKHPEVILARRFRDGAARRARELHTTISRSKGSSSHARYLQAQRAYVQTKKEIHKATLKQIKARYRAEQPVSDIRRQLQANKQIESASAASQTQQKRVLSEERQRALKALLTFADTKAEEDHVRRAEAVAAVWALCRRQELPMRRRFHPQPVCAAYTGSDQQKPSDPIECDPFPLKCAPTQCIFCLGDEELSLAARTKAFRDQDGLKRHFLRKHLQHHPNGEQICCPHPKCRVVRLQDADHLRNHAARVHCTRT